MSTQPTMTTLDDLRELVAVAPESTVSRTVLKADGVRVVVFAFDTGQVLTEHTAAMPVLLQAVDGRLRIVGDGKESILVPGGIIHLDTRVPHSVEALEPSRLVLTMVDARARPVQDATGIAQS